MRTQAPLHKAREAHPAWILAPLATVAAMVLASVLAVAFGPPLDDDITVQAAVQATGPVEAAPPPALPAPNEAARSEEVEHVQAF